MTPYCADDQVTLYHGDCLDVLAELPDCSVDAVCTDPPYGLEFMGKEWDSFGGDTRQPFRGEIQTPDNPFGRSTVRYGGTSSLGGKHAAAMLSFQQWCEQWATECLRVLKPGGHMLAFGGSRTWHRLASAVEDAGFEIRDSIAWLYGSGFPKSMDVSKAIDKGEGHWRGRAGSVASDNGSMGGPNYERTPKGDPVTAAAAAWQGWGTALKPAFEPIVVARKPLAGTVAANVLAHGTGALNIDACRVETGDSLGGGAEAGSVKFTHEGWNRPWMDDAAAVSAHRERKRANVEKAESLGRWPANVVLDESQAAELDQQTGELSSGVLAAHHARNPKDAGILGAYGSAEGERGYGDTGGASRFFYVPKPDSPEERAGCAVRARVEAVLNGPTIDGADRKRIREALATDCACPPCPGRGNDGHGMTHCAECCFGTGVEADIDCPTHGDHLPPFRYVAKADQSERVKVDGIAHPTVKPLDLMRWLVRLVTPPGGTVLEPFAGSGTTVGACLLEGFNVIGIEREADYLPLIRQRIDRRRDPVAAVRATGDDAGLFDLIDGGGDAA
ncbi:DNA-methyltransferase [Nocardioides montaniterrae]